MDRLVTAPAREVLTLAEGRNQVGGATDPEDVLELQAFISAARETVENLTSRQLITATREAHLPGWPTTEITLPRAPVQSVTKIEYYDVAGTLQELAASVYQVDTVSQRARVALAPGESWPTLEAGRLLPVIVTYLAGYGADPSAVPAALKMATRLLVGHWWENRAAADVAVMREIPLGVRALLADTARGV